MSNIRGHRVDPNEASDMLRYAKRRFTNNGLGTHEDTVNDFKAADLGKLAQLGSKTPTTLLYRLISNKTDNLVMG